MKKTLHDSFTELGVAASELKHQMIASIPNQALKSFLGKALGADMERIAYLTSTSSSNLVKEWAKFLMECDRRGFDYRMVIDIAKCSPWSTSSILFQVQSVEELEALHAYYVKEDREKWLRLEAEKLLKTFETS